MATIEEVARLILEADVKGFADAKAQITSTEAALGKLTADYKSGAIGIEEYQKNGSRLVSQLDQSKAAYETATDAVKKHGNAQAAAAAMAAQASQRSMAAQKGAQQAMLEFSRGVEDFSTGGFLGVLNNIPRTFEGIGQAIGLSANALAGWTTGISLAATGAYVLYKNWDTIVQLFQETHPFQRAAEDIAGMERELKAAKERLEELEKLSDHTVAQAEEYNKVRGRTVELEEKITREKQVQSDLDKLRKLEPDAEGRDERAKMLKGVIAETPDIDALVTGVARARKAQLNKLLLQLGKDAANMPEGSSRTALNEQAMEISLELNDFKRTMAKAKEMVTQAVEHGQVSDIGDIVTLMHQVPQHFIPEHQAAFEKAEAMPKPLTEAQQKFFDKFWDDWEASEKKQEKGKEFMDRFWRDWEASEKKDGQAFMDLFWRDWEASEKAQAARMKKEGQIFMNQFWRDWEASEKQEVARNRADRRQQGKGMAAFGKDVAGQAKAMDGFQANAEAAIAQGLAGGKLAMGGDGKLTAASFEAVNQMIARELARQMPGLKNDPMRAAALTTQIAANSEKGVGEKLLGQVGMGMNAHLATQAVVMETQAAVAALANKLQRVEARNGQLARNAQDLQRRAAAPGPTNLDAGVH